MLGSMCATRASTQIYWATTVLGVYCGCSPTATTRFCSSCLWDWRMGGLGSLEQQNSNYHHCHLKLQIYLGSGPQFKEIMLYKTLWKVMTDLLIKSFWSEILSLKVHDPHHILNSAPWYWYCMRSIEGEGGSNKSAINISPPTIKYTSSWGYTAN